MNTDHDTIVAPATAAGGAIAVIRISGGEAFAVCDQIFRNGKSTDPVYIFIGQGPTAGHKRKFIHSIIGIRTG